MFSLSIRFQNCIVFLSTSVIFLRIPLTHLASYALEYVTEPMEIIE